MKSVLLTSVLLAIATTATAAEYKVDPYHTNVRFETDHFNTSTNTGGFYGLEGVVKFDSAKKEGSVDIQIPMKSLLSTSPRYTAHLLSADIFQQEKFPSARFVSTKFNFDGDKVSSVVGDLTLLGQTHPVELKAERFNCYDSPMLKTQVCGGDFIAMIDRTQWGLNYAVHSEKSKQVVLRIQIEAAKQ